MSYVIYGNNLGLCRLFMNSHCNRSASFQIHVFPVYNLQRDREHRCLLVGLCTTVQCHHVAVLMDIVKALCIF